MSKLTASEVANRDLKVNVFHVYVIEDETTGGQYVTVRKNISIKALWSLIKAGSRDPNFSMPILAAVRDAGDQNSSLEESQFDIRRVATFTTKVEAQELASKLIEKNAFEARALNAARPKVGASETFQWLSEEASQAVLAERTKA